MKTLALAILLAGAAAAQDTQAAPALTDAQSSELGGFAADRLDANPAAEELERALVEKIDALRKGTATGGKEEPAKARGKKKKGKKAAKGGSNPQPDTIKNGLTEADRIVLGKFVATEIGGGHKGGALMESVKKELARLRNERVKASSTADAKPAKKKKKQATN